MVLLSLFNSDRFVPRGLILLVRSGRLSFESAVVFGEALGAVPYGVSNNLEVFVIPTRVSVHVGWLGWHGDAVPAGRVAGHGFRAGCTSVEGVWSFGSWGRWKLLPTADRLLWAVSSSFGGQHPGGGPAQRHLA